MVGMGHGGVQLTGEQSPKELRLLLLGIAWAMIE